MKKWTHSIGSTNSGMDTDQGRAFDAGYAQTQEPPKYAHLAGPPLSDINALTLATWFAMGARWQYEQLYSAQESKKD